MRNQFRTSIIYNTEYIALTGISVSLMFKEVQTLCFCMYMVGF